MYSPSKFPRSPGTSVVPIKGLFKEGAWCCDCQDRPPAVKLQVKKEGRNQGRYFYKCQKPQPQQCKFFLWKEEAEPREQAVVLSNSRSEDDLRYPTLPTASTPSTPRRNGLLTPQTERRFIDIPPRQAHTRSPPKSAKARMMLEDTDEFGWDDTSDENNQLSELSTSHSTEPFLSQPNFHPDKPYKAARTPTATSPGKRKLFESSFHSQDHDHDTSTGSSSILPTPSSTHSIRSSRIPPSSAELCMTPTPTKYRDAINSDNMPFMTDLAHELNVIMEKHDVVLSNKARDEVYDLLNRQELKLKGANRGRDFIRDTVKKRDEVIAQKDAEIKKLQNTIMGLQAQKELDQRILDSLSSHS